MKTIAAAVALIGALALSQLTACQDQLPTAKAHSIAKTTRRY